jgi:hypothetical protein
MAYTLFEETMRSTIDKLQLGHDYMMNNVLPVQTVRSNKDLVIYKNGLVAFVAKLHSMRRVVLAIVSTSVTVRFTPSPC